MRCFATIVTVLLFYSGVAMAQAQGDKPDAAQPAEVKLVTGNESRHARDADARYCLDLKSDVQIIRCAEKYRYSR